MVGHGGSSAGSYLADPTSPIPSHCASIVVTSTLSVKYRQYICLFPAPWTCVDTFTEHNDKYTTSGFVQDHTTSLQLCREKCLEKLNCYGFDWHALEQECYFFFDEHGVHRFEDRNNVTHFIRNRCHQREYLIMNCTYIYIIS